MRGQGSGGNSFADTIDLNQGSVPNNNSTDMHTSRNMLYTMNNHNVRSFDGWHIGESSSSSIPNLQSQGLDGNVKNESPFDTPSVGLSNSLVRDSVSRPSSGSSRTPLNVNLNSEHMASGSDRVLETADAFPYHIEDNNGASSSSFGDWSSSVKRKTLDGASSNFFQHGETFIQQDLHAYHSSSSSLSMSSPPLHSPSLSNSEELSLRIGIGRGVAPDVFPPISITESGESSSRRHGVRVNNDYDLFNLPVTRNTMRQSDLRNRHQSSRPTPPYDTFEFRPVSSSARSQTQSIQASDLPRNMTHFAFQGATNSRAGRSSSSTVMLAERGFSLRDERNSASITRNSMEHSSSDPFSEIRNHLNLSPENVRNFTMRDEGNSASITRNSMEHSLSDPFSEIRNNLNLSPWATPQHYASSQNVQRSSQVYPWDPFPLSESESGNWNGGHFPRLRTGQSSAEQTMTPSGANQGHHHRTPFSRSSMMMELQGDDLSGWHDLAADIEGRQRLVSEIRHVLNAMRRGDNLRDEDYMLFDPVINGIAEFHDRHRDMRLDVDNMSYEELLALEERIGYVNTGLSEEAILGSMKQRKHLCLFDSSSSTLEPCSICREEYVLGDNVGELDCGHDFHTDCIKQWLTQKNLCPICKMTALDA